MILFSVYDSVSGVWQDPIVAHNEAEASRGFMISCINPAIPETYLRDIALYRIGEFNETNGTGVFYPPVRIMFGDDSNVIHYREISRKSNEAGGDSNEVSE